MLKVRKFGLRSSNFYRGVGKDQLRFLQVPFLDYRSYVE